MNQISKFFSFVFTVLFFVQSNAWAGVSLTKEEVRYGYLESMKTRPQKDVEFMKSQKVESMNFPSVKDGVFYLDNKKIVVKVLTDTLIEINGKSFDFSPGNLEKVANEIEQHLYPKKVSLMDFFVSPAHASGFTLMVVGLTAVMAVGVSALWLYGSPMRRTRYKCGKFEHWVNILDQSNKDWLIPRAKKQMSEELSRIDNNQECKDPKNSKDDQCIADKNLKACINKLTPELDRAIAAVNDSGREIDREEVTPVNKEMRPSSSSTAQ